MKERDFQWYTDHDGQARYGTLLQFVKLSNGKIVAMMLTPSGYVEQVPFEKLKEKL